MPERLKDILSAPIPLSVVLFLIVQTMAFVWWASAQMAAVNLHMASIDMKVEQIEKAQGSVVSHEGRIIVLEQIAGRVRDDLQEIKVILRGEKQGFLSSEDHPEFAQTPHPTRQ